MGIDLQAGNMNTSQNNHTSNLSESKTTVKSEDPYYNYNSIINVYLAPVIVIVGICGNIVILLTMKNKKFKGKSLRVYFSVLAVFDTIVLCMVGLNQWVLHVFKKSAFRTVSFCYFWKFFLHTCVAVTAWIIVIMAVERYLVVRFPVKAKQLWSYKKTVIAVFAVVGFFALLASYNIWMADFGDPNCGLRPEFWWVTKPNIAWLILVMYNLIPFCLSSLFYGLLIHQVWKTKNRRAGLFNQNLKETKLTVTAAYICLGFLILTTPTAIWLLLRQVFGWKQRFPKVCQLVDSIVFFFRLMNYATNVFIYIASNREFRNLSRKLVGYQRRVAPLPPPAVSSSPHLQM